MSQINVQDKTITTSVIVKSIEIMSTEVKLNEAAYFMVKSLDENGNLVNIERVSMEGNDYSNWGSDDNYVIDFILTSLGLTKQ